MLQVAGVAMHGCYERYGLREQFSEGSLWLDAQVGEELKAKVPDVPRCAVNTAIGEFRRAAGPVEQNRNRVGATNEILVCFV